MNLGNVNFEDELVIYNLNHSGNELKKCSFIIIDITSYKDFQALPYSGYKILQ